MTYKARGAGVALENPGAPKSRSILDKCTDFTIPDDLKAKGIYPYHRVIDSGQDTEVIVEAAPC